MSGHKGAPIRESLPPIFVSRELAYAVASLVLATALALVAYAFFARYSVEVNTVGDSWLKLPVPIPLEQRRTYLRIAMFLFGMALFSLLASISLFLAYWNNAEARETVRQERARRRDYRMRLAEMARQEHLSREAHRLWLVEKARKERLEQEARNQWLATPAGHAQSLLEAGHSEMRLVLRVQPPLHLDTVREVESVGWVVGERLDHPPVATKVSTADGEGGHEVVRSTVQDATFIFVRKNSDSQPAAG